MHLISDHLILVFAQNKEQACLQVQKFFKNTLLVQYDAVDILKDECLAATETEFKDKLNEAISRNQETLQKFISEFEKTGFKTLADLQHVEHGYPSKMLHIITHFLDGFIGVDTAFYNLIDDSHWVTDATYEKIKNDPSSHWLIPLLGFSETPDKVAIVQQ